MPTLRFIKRRNTDVRLSSIPLAVMEPPKHMAQMISQIVFIIPAIPRVADQAVQGLVARIDLGTPVDVMNNPLNREEASATDAPATSCNK